MGVYLTQAGDVGVGLWCCIRRRFPAPCIICFTRPGEWCFSQSGGPARATTASAAKDAF